MKKNWIYVVLLCFIILVNVLSRFEEKEELLDEVKVESEETQTLFVDFEEAQRRSKKIEDILKVNLPLRLFYMFLNSLIVFIFFLGLVANGYFILSLFKKRALFRRIRNINPPQWEMGEVFKIIILGLTFSYVFFMLFGFFTGALESATGTELQVFKNENFRMIFDTIILDFIILLIILKFLWNIHGKKIANLGLVKDNMARNIFYGISGYVAVMPIIFTIGILIYILLNVLELEPPPQPIVGLFLMEKNVALVFASSVIASVFGPVIEEIFFRGVMYSAVKRKLGVFWGIFITSILFSFLHTHAFTYFLVGFIPIAILGGVLAYLYEKTGSLIPSITLHILNNMGSVFMVFLFKYFNSLV